MHHEKYDVMVLGVFLNVLNLVLQGQHGEGEEEEGGSVATHNRLKSDCTPSSLSAILEIGNNSSDIICGLLAGPPSPLCQAFSNRRLKWDIVSRGETASPCRDKNSSR